jgi:hypothetical protein
MTALDAGLVHHRHKLLNQERLGELRDAIGQPRPVRRVGKPQVHLRVGNHRVLSRILPRTLPCAIHSSVLMLIPLQRQR